MTRVVFHIGVHRTGTTGLQRTLASSREILAERGFSYPGNTTNHGWLNHQLRSGVNAGWLAGWLEKKAHGDAHTVILSCEDFVRNLDLSAIAKLGKEFDVECIVYLRRQDEWLNSWYCVNLWWPWHYGHWNSTPEQFLDAWRAGEFHWIDYRSLLDRWAEAVGRERMTVRVYGGDTWLDFARTLGLPELQKPNITVNASPPAVILPLLALFPPESLAHGQRSRINTGLIRAAEAAGLAQTRQVFSPEIRAEMLASYDATNRSVAEKWFGREQLFDDEMRDPDFVDLSELNVPELALRLLPALARDLA